MKHVFLVMLFLLVAGFGCGKKDEVKPNGPDVIEYRVSSASGVTVADLITYANETEGPTSLENVTLPFSVKFNSTKKPRTLSLFVLLPDQNGQQQSVIGTILVNGKEVDTDTGTGPSAAISMGYYLQ